MATYLNVLCENGYLTEKSLSQALGTVAVVTVEFNWEGSHVFTIAVEGNPKSAESRVKDLLFKAGFRNGLKYLIQPEMEIRWKPEGFIRHRKDPQR